MCIIPSVHDCNLSANLATKEDFRNSVYTQRLSHAGLQAYSQASQYTCFPVTLFFSADVKLDEKQATAMKT